MNSNLEKKEEANLWWNDGIVRINKKYEQDGFDGLAESVNW